MIRELVQFTLSPLLATSVIMDAATIEPALRLEGIRTAHVTPRSISLLNQDKPSATDQARLAHVRGLLGKGRNSSILKSAQEVRKIDDWLKQLIKRSLKGASKSQCRKVAKAIFEESKRYSFDPLFLVAVIESESSFNLKARGPYGEIGLMQIRPETGKWIADKRKIRWKGARSLEDPVMNIRIGAAYLDMLRSRFNSHAQLYLAAYNMGSRNVGNKLEQNMWPKIYPLKVMQRYLRLYNEFRVDATRQAA